MKNRAPGSQFAELGVISEEAAEDPKVFREDAARVLEQLGPKLKDLHEDPALQALAERRAGGHQAGGEDQGFAHGGPPRVRAAPTGQAAPRSWPT